MRKQKAMGNREHNKMDQEAATRTVPGRPQQVRGPMQDLSAGPLWAVVLWHHCAQTTVLQLFDENFFSKMVYINIKKEGKLYWSWSVCMGVGRTFSRWGH